MTEPSNASDRHTAHDEEHSSTMDLTPPNSASEPGDSPQAASSVVAYLSIRKQPPTHVFSDEVIEVEFTIEAARGSSDSPPTNVQMQAALQVLEDEESTPAQLRSQGDDGSKFPGGIKGTAAAASALRIKILEEPRVSASRRTGKLRCRISSSTSLPRACAIRLFTKDNIVSEVVTRRIYIVSSKLKVLADNWNFIWFKDEGGRDKCMEVQVAVYNSNDQLVPDNAQLKLTLCYDEKSNFLAVINQDLLRSLGTKPVHQLDGGRCRLRFRIEDVSKNHQGQDFCVKVESSNPLVAPGYTPSVSVRSKRNKRQRTSISSSGSVDTSSAPPARGAPPTLQPAYGQYPSYGTSLVEGSTSAPAGSALDPQTLRGAVQGVMQWAEEVVNGLYPLQWQVLGYAQHVDGSPDYSRPYHSMPNPNMQISRILSLYSEETRNHLRLLDDAASRAVFGTSVASDSGVSGSVGAQQSSVLAMGAARESPYPAHDPYASASLHLQGPHAAPPQAQFVNRPLPLSSSAMAPSTGSPAMHPPPPQLPMPPRGSALMAPPPTHMMAEGTYRDYPFTDYYGRQVPQPPPPVPYPHYHRYDESADSLTLRASSKTAQHHHRSPAAVDARVAEDEEVDDDPDDDDTHESNVEYVLAKQYKSLRTGQHLGFPAFSVRKKILGFYRETPSPPSGLDASGSVAAGSSRPPLQDQHHHHFVALRRDSVDYDEIVQQAEVVLQKAFDSNSEALHALKDWGSIRSMVDHALVYDWSKDMGGSSSGAGSATSVRHRHHSSR